MEFPIIHTGLEKNKIVRHRPIRNKWSIEKRAHRNVYLPSRRQRSWAWRCGFSSVATSPGGTFCDSDMRAGPVSKNLGRCRDLARVIRVAKITARREKAIPIKTNVRLVAIVV